MRTQILIAATIFLVCTQALSQKLPQPSREVFRCEVNGKVSYSDSPCLGAKKVDVEPTRGLTSTGKEGAGADVRREHFNEGIAEALKPLTGKDAKQLQVDSKRLKLSASAQRECRELDIAIPEAEKREQLSAPNNRLPVQQELLALRKRFARLGC